VPDTWLNPDLRADAIERGLAALTTADDETLSDTQVLQRLDKAKCRALLVSLRSDPIRLVVPLRTGMNIVAREEDLTEHEVSVSASLLSGSFGWPRFWCEAAQVHILCTALRRAFVADRSTAWTTLWPAAAPFDIRDVEPSFPDVFYERNVTGACEIAPWSVASELWTPLAQGDVLLCVRSPWVFAWMPPSSADGAW
jgi:hypothetical protein